MTIREKIKEFVGSIIFLTLLMGFIYLWLIAFPYGN